MIKYQLRIQSSLSFAAWVTANSQPSFAAMLRGENCLLAKVSVVNYSPCKDGCLCEINDVLINKPADGGDISVLWNTNFKDKQTVLTLSFFIYEDPSAVACRPMWLFLDIWELDAKHLSCYWQILEITQNKVHRFLEEITSILNKMQDCISIIFGVVHSSGA